MEMIPNAEREKIYKERTKRVRVGILTISVGHSNAGDKVMWVTYLRCWRKNDKIGYFFAMSKNLSLTSHTCRQQQQSPTTVINICHQYRSNHWCQNWIFNLKSSVLNIAVRAVTRTFSFFRLQFKQNP